MQSVQEMVCPCGVRGDRRRGRTCPPHVGAQLALFAGRDFRCAEGHDCLHEGACARRQERETGRPRHLFGRSDHPARGFGQGVLRLGQHHERPSAGKAHGHAPLGGADARGADAAVQRVLGGERRDDGIAHGAEASPAGGTACRRRVFFSDSFICRNLSQIKSLSLQGMAGRAAQL